MTPGPDRTVEVFQRVPGTPDAVFPYFTDREKYLEWQGVDAVLDPRPGGIYRVDLGGGVSVEGAYLVVEPPHRVVFSWGWRGSPVPPGVAEVAPGSTRVEVTFTSVGEDTLVRLRHSDLPTEEAGTFHRWGWGAFLERLHMVRTGRDPGPHASVPASSDWIVPPVA